MHRSLVFILCALILAACQLSNGNASPPTPTLDLPAIKTVAAETTIAQLTEVAAAATPTPSAIPTVTVSLTAALTPPQNWVPMLELAKVPGLLQSSLSVEKADAFDDHDLQKIIGWEYGLDHFQWMGENHLLVSAIFGPRGGEGPSLQPSYPAVINLDTKEVWVPKLTENAVWDRIRPLHQYLPRWSSKLDALITSKTTPNGEAVMLYSADGDIIATYPGQLLGISPSGTKLLFKDGTWLDLLSSKTVHFTWNQGYIDEYYHRPVWSESENRVYVSQYLFGDAETGDSYAAQDDKRGRNGTAGTYDLANGVWALNDKYLMGGCCDNWFFGGPPTYFDVSTKTFHYLSELVNIPMDNIEHEEGNQCNYWFISPNGKNVWLACSKNDYLVDLATRKFNQYPQYIISDIQWSSDGKFAWFNGLDRNQQNSIQILSVTGKELKPLPAKTLFYTSLWWHPTNNILAYLSNKGQTLSLLDARIMSVQKEMALPVEFQELIWSPNGKRIALLARDSSLWQIDYPSLENLEQLTPAMPELTGRKNVTWSPDGASLAFIGNTDIYIVDTQVKP